MTDRYNIENQIELLQTKYIGTGNADVSKWEWGNNMQRDTLNSHIQNPSRSNYFSICENLPSKLIQRNLLEKMILPLGPQSKIKNNKLN